MKEDYILFPEDKEKMDKARRKHNVSAPSSNELLYEDKLKWAYCKQVGADSIIGLDCCDNYIDWRNSLGA